MRAVSAWGLARTVPLRQIRCAGADPHRAGAEPPCVDVGACVLEERLVQGEQVVGSHRLMTVVADGVGCDGDP